MSSKKPNQPGIKSSGILSVVPTTSSTLVLGSLVWMLACCLAACDNGESTPVDAAIDAAIDAGDATGDATGDDPGWATQIGGDNIELGYALAVDPTGNVYAVGDTGSAELGGQTAAGSGDGLVVKLRSDGTVEWTRLLGTTAYDSVAGVAVDGTGNACLVGNTGGELGGTYHGGQGDVFLAKMKPDGTTTWIVNIGSSGYDMATGVATDKEGNCYAAGMTELTVGEGKNSGHEDAFIVKYSAEGELAWARTFGTAGGDMGTALAVDEAGNAYVTGYTVGAFGETKNAGALDVFVVKYSSDGTKGWAWQLGGESEEYPNGIVADSKNSAIYLTGYTLSSLDGKTNQGDKDVFLIKLGTDGQKLWTEQFGTEKKETGFGIDLNATDGTVYISGRTEGELTTSTIKGTVDYFVAKYEPSGQRAWIVQDGSEGVDPSWDLAIGPDSRIHIIGFTNGVIGAANAGSFDIYVKKLEWNVGSAQ
ncbi:MAG: SBBP repeat-containing protein [Pseudomonadota bacterium]